MDLFAAINPLLVVSGFVVGMLVGLTGVGGGSLMTPILVLLFGVHATTAVGTDLLYAAITKTGGTLTHQGVAVLYPQGISPRPCCCTCRETGAT